MDHPLEKYRKENDLTLDELGKIIAVDKGNLSRMINTGSAIRKDLCDRIFKTIGVNIKPNKRIFDIPLTPKEYQIIDKVVDKFNEDAPNYIAASFKSDKPNMYKVPLKAWGGFMAGYAKQVLDRLKD